MSTRVRIVGTEENVAEVTEFGQLVTAPAKYSVASVGTLSADDTGVMFIEPKQGSKIVITSAVLYADRNVSSTIEADVELYESLTGSGQTVETSILQTSLLKQQSVVIPLNYITSSGIWVMGKTSDNNVKVSIYYYYIEEQ